MNKLDINGFYRVTSFLKPIEIKTLGISSKHVYNNCRNFMTYLYSEHCCNESYYRMNTTKWIVDKCNWDILSDCINKNLTINSIIFNDEFNVSVESFGKCTNLRQITFGSCFNKSIEALSHCSCYFLEKVSSG